MTLFDRVFSGNDAVYGLTENAINAAIDQYGEDKAVSFPHTAYSLPCYYAVTGTKVANLKDLKDALGVVKTLMTREKRLNDAFMSGVATALCAEFIEALKYIDGATPYEEPLYGHLPDSAIRELGVPLVTGDIPGVAVILGAAPSVEEGVALVKSYQAQGILVTLVGGICDQIAEAGMNTGANLRHSAWKRCDKCDPCSIGCTESCFDFRKYSAGRRRKLNEVYDGTCAGICKCVRSS